MNPLSFDQNEKWFDQITKEDFDALILKRIVMILLFTAVGIAIISQGELFRQWTEFNAEQIEK